MKRKCAADVASPLGDFLIGTVRLRDALLKIRRRVGRKVLPCAE
jgi:hypothetical protein